MIFDESLNSRPILKMPEQHQKPGTSIQSVIDWREEQIVLDNLTNIYTVF